MHDENSIVRKSTLVSKKPWWCLLALALILKKDYNKIIEEYCYEFERDGYRKEFILNRIQIYNDKNINIDDFIKIRK